MIITTFVMGIILYGISILEALMIKGELSGICMASEIIRKSGQSA